MPPDDARRRSNLILIAEDSPTQAAQLSFLLGEQGHEVLLARNGQEALALAREQRPDLIISDVMMPVMDGYALCRSIKSERALQDIPVILVTELSSPHNVFKGLDAGADNFIVKPYDGAVLLSRISYLFTNRELRKSGKLQVGIEIELSGQRHFITAERQQILDLLISTYEQAVRLYDELEQRQRELSRSYETLNALYDMADGLNRCRTEREVAANAVERGLRLPGVRAGWVYLGQGGRFRLAATSKSLAGVLDDLDAATCSCRRKLAAGELAQAVNVLECECLERVAQRQGLRYHASVPLIAHGEAIGLLNLAGSDRRMFSDDELRTLGSVGSQIATALERARLHESLERKVEERTRALALEVAERRQAELGALRAGEGYRRANETVTAVLDSSPVAIFTLDAGLRVMTWNRAAEAIFGYATEEMVGRPHLLTAPGHEAENERLFGAILAGRAVRALDTRMRRQDGSLVDVRASGTPLTDAAGTPAGGVFAIEDLSERKRMEEHLRHAQKMDAIGKLTGGIAHDFNNLLTIITGNLDLALEATKDRPAAAELIEGALSASLRGGELNRQLLAFARRQTLEPETIDVNGLVRGMVRLLSRTLGGNIRLELFEAPEPWPVTVDAARLESVIVNFAINARDAMPNGGTLSIRTRNQTVDETYAAAVADLRPGDYLLIEVTDTGTGIPPEIASRIFEPFFTTKEPGKGTGLGLAMVYGFVKQSGGHVSVYSEVGHGTTFKLYLPRATEPVGSSVRPVADGAAAARPATREVILVVEDNISVRLGAERQLTDLGYRILAVASADEAVKLLETGEHVDLVFTDVIMPGELNGIDLADLVVRRWPHLRVLLTSGFADVALARLNRPDAPLLLNKPYRRADLERRIRQALG